MIFRLSQKLATHLRTEPLPALPLHSNPFIDFSAHLFFADRTKYVIFCNTRSLYSTVFYGREISDDNDFIRRALGALRDLMEDDGQQFLYERLIAPATGTITYAKALNRSVTSSMNDLVSHATMLLTEDDLSPHDVSFKLNDMPFSSLLTPDGKRYARPREAFKALLQNPIPESA